MATRILVIEDEPAIADTLTYALSTEGFEPVWCTTGEAALASLRQSNFAMALLDVGLPDINGFDLFKEIQRHWPLPIVFLTARSGEIDRVVGLELGADDYILKPFSPREVVARVRMVLRRAQRAGAPAAPAPAPAMQAPFTVDEERKAISFHGRMLELSRTEYRLLKTLVERPGRVYSRQELMDQAWEHPDVSLDRTVDAHIKQLRAKLREIDPGSDPIQTHRGLGYSLKEGK
ncbi:MAG: two-component system response regulator CreB [Burkholderiales bacterium]|nr:two-component system response regulator CreB [Burkholderiales bacterium]